MSEVLWLNVPLMVIAFSLMAGVPLWLVLRRHDWHGKPEARAVPAYLAELRADRDRVSLNHATRPTPELASGGASR